MALTPLKSNKTLYVLNIIMFVILLVCVIIDCFILPSLFDALSQIKNGADSGETAGAAIGLAILLSFQVILLIPYAICALVAIITAIKKYFNWLSIVNMGASWLGVILTVVLLVIV